MRIDLHVHTKYSGHSILGIHQIVKAAKKRALDCVAITDHDEIKGALELSKVFPTVIGEEVSADEGDVIGLFLKERIQPGPALEVMDRIRSQGGLVMIPHPFDTLRSEALRNEELCTKADLIEVFNSRVLRNSDNDRARAFAREHEIATCVGSDAHTATEVGRCWMDLDPFDNPTQFMKSLQSAEIYTSRSPSLVHAQTKILKVVEALK